MNHFIVKVKVKFSDGEKIKEKTEAYIAWDAETPTIAEAIVTKQFADDPNEWEIISIVKSPIRNVLWMDDKKLKTLMNDNTLDA